MTATDWATQRRQGNRMLRSQAQANAAAEGKGWHVHNTPRQLTDDPAAFLGETEEPPMCRCGRHYVGAPCPMANAPRPGAAARRAAVALRLAAVLADHGATAEQADQLPPGSWRMTARLASDAAGDDWTPADDYTPSPATRAATVAVLADRAKATDPFDGFPS